MNNTSYKLTNNHLKINIHSKGAELSSIQRNNQEFLWQADAQFWGRHAPILFPIVGRLIDDEYIYKGETYNLRQHGFARDQVFQLFAQANNSLTFELVSNEELLEVYPFDFVLQVKYTLLESGVKVDYLVKNPSADEDLLFSIGAHPAFNCPMEKGHRREEYQLKFDKDISPMAYLAENSYYNGETVDVMARDGVLNLSNTIFDKGSLTFRPNPFAQATLIHQPTGKEYLKMSFDNYPFLAIWSKDRHSPFVCIEPWHGVADNMTHNKALAQKAGIIRLSPNQYFECSYMIEILVL